MLREPFRVNSRRQDRQNLSGRQSSNIPLNLNVRELFGLFQADFLRDHRCRGADVVCRWRRERVAARCIRGDHDRRLST